VTPKGQIKIMDFGLAKVKGATKLTKVGSTVGTAAYMSPEQAKGEEIDARSDIFSVGVVFYELITTKLPFRGEHQAALMYSLMNEDPQPIARFNDKVSPELERIVLKALAKDKEDRYQHADDLLADIRRERKNMEYAKAGYVRTSSITQTPVTETKQRPVPWKYIIPAASLVAVIVALIIFNPFRPSQQKTSGVGGAAEQNSLAVMYFQNIPDPDDKDHTGDMLADLLITALSQTKGLEVISRERLFDIQKDLKADSKSITPDMATKVAQRAGVTTMLLGTILQKEPDLAITARLIDVTSGKIVSSQRVTGFSSKQIFKLVDTLALLVRNDLRIASASEETKAVSDVTTSSEEAYRSYVVGVDLDSKFYTNEAKAAFNRAIELDGNFAMAYFRMATLNLDPSDNSIRRNALEKAYQLRGKVTEKERLQIEASYAGRIENDPLKAGAILENLVQKYPREQGGYGALTFAYLSVLENEKALQTSLIALKNDPFDKINCNSQAYLYAGGGSKKEAMETINRYLNLAPGEPNPYDSKGELHVSFGELDSAKYWFQKALSFRTDFTSSQTLGFIAIVQQDYAAAEKCFQQYGSTPDRFQKADAELSLTNSTVHRGQIEAASKQLMAKLASFQDQKLQGPLLNTYLALIFTSFEKKDYAGMLDLSKRYSDELRKDANDKIYGRSLLALAYQKNGNASAASSIMNELQIELKASLPLDQVEYDYTTALLAYEEGKYNAAVDGFQKSFRKLLPNHAPQFYYAVSLLKLGRVSEAIQELDRTTQWVPISFPPISLFFMPTWAYWPIASVKAHYWLGVAYEQQGEKQKAIAEYEKFLEIWKEADFKSSELDDARARLAKLK